MSSYTSLLVCPKNLKECIDWVLRATERDGQNGTKDNIENLKNALEAELGSSVKDVDLTQLNALASGLKSFIGYSGGSLTGTGIGKNGTGGGSQYVSSYKSPDATWEKLCENCKCKSVSNSSHSCSCGPKSVSSVCSNPDQCCENCDVRKAAKIFLGFIPCLYYALKYLYKQCKKDESEGGWNTLKISNKDSSLGSFFRGMGYAETDLEPSVQGSQISSSLSSLLNDSKGSLDIVYKEVKGKYFPSPSLVFPSDSQPKTPETVRDILLWLSGLPFTSGFEALLKHCKGLCEPVNSLKFNDFKTYLFDSCFLSPFVLGAIEGSKSNEKGFPLYKSEISKFSYPEDPFKLFETFCDFVRKIFVALIFLKFQCERPSDQAGWRECYFGQNCSVSSSSVSSAPSGCTSCKGHDKYLCSNSHSCSSSSCSSSCPHPLMAFLIDGSSDPKSKPQSSVSKSQSQDSSPFRLPSSFARIDFSQTPPAILDASQDFLTMGFSKENLPKKARQGNSIAPILNSFCGSKTSPLTKLFEFSLFVAMRPPETLIELYVFFVKFRLSGPLKDHFPQYASMEPGTPDGSALKTAIVNLYDFSGHPSGSSASHPYDLWSLFGCSGPKGSGSPPTCGRYLYPLYNVAGVFSEKFCAVYLSYVCHLGKALKLLLEKFHEEASTKFKCCLESSCPSIVKCHCALPFLYTYGFTFYQPERLNCHGTQSGHTPGQGQNCILKSCQNFLEQLGKVVGENSPLDLLIKQIESFLWSIRKPFFLFILAFWAFVISYLLYVQFYKLDLLHLKSHAHFSRSFKILPSTLFSDASSRLKDLSYFTL